MSRTADRAAGVRTGYPLPRRGAWSGTKPARKATTRSDRARVRDALKVGVEPATVPHRHEAKRDLY